MNINFFSINLILFAGLAPIGGMCTSSSSCTVNEGRHFEAVYVVAHEIGHKYDYYITLKIVTFNYFLMKM